MNPTNSVPKAYLFVDLDGTAAEWRAGANYEALYEKGYFRSLEPHKEVVEAVNSIIVTRPDIEVWSLSAYLPDSKYALHEKNEWVSEHMPGIPHEHRLFCPTAASKPEWASCALSELGREIDFRRCFLLDDYSANLHEWISWNGVGIKLLNGINGTNGTWKGFVVGRFAPTDEIARFIAEVIDAQTALAV